MKAWRIQQFGMENLSLDEIPKPKPGPGQVLVAVQAVSLNYRDLMMVKGIYNPRLQTPRIPCSDGAGIVEEIGEGVTTVKAGDRVAGIFMQNWLEGEPSSAKQKGALGGDIDGMLAEYVVLAESGLVPLPPYLSFEESATLPCAGVTAWNALTRASQTMPGNTVLVQGTGGVSIFALQFAKAMGCRVLGTSSSDEKLARATNLGLAAACNYKTTPAWEKWVVEQTGGVGADLVVEVGGAGTFAKSLQAVRIGGVVAQIGVLSGVEQPIQITPILHKMIRVNGVYVGSRQNFLAMNQALEVTGLRPVLDTIYPFAEAPKALQTMEKASHFGKIAISI